MIVWLFERYKRTTLNFLKHRLIWKIDVLMNVFWTGYVHVDRSSSTTTAWQNFIPSVSFKLTKQDNYFWVTFDHFWSECHFLRQLISKSWLEPKNQTKIYQVKLVQMHDTHCSSGDLNVNLNFNLKDPEAFL